MDEQLHLRALAIMGETVVFDAHSHFLLNGHYLGKKFNKRHKPPWLWNPLRNTIDLPRLREGRVSCSTFTVYVPPPPLRLSAYAACLRHLDSLDRIVAASADEVVAVDSVRGIRAALSNGLLAALPAVEGGHVLGKRVERVAELRVRGVRILTLTHFIANRICDGSVRPFVHKGLSDFGRAVIRACEQAGVVVDLAHCSDAAFDQALDQLSLPPMVTHTALRGGRGNQRYLIPDQIRRVAAAGGVMGVIWWPWYLKSGSIMGKMDLILDTYARMAEIAGPEHLMIGTDMDGYTWLPRDLRQASDMPRLCAGLLSRGFSEDEVRGILGENALRVLEAWE